MTITAIAIALNGRSANFDAYHGNQPPPDLKLHRLTAAVDVESEE